MGPIDVLILFNQPLLPSGHPNFESEHEILATVKVVEATLSHAGFGVSRLGCNRDVDRLVARLRERPPNVIFNLFEGAPDQGHTEAFVAGLLELYQVPFTGCPAQTLALARNKHLTKFIFKGAGLPTPSFLVVDKLPVPDCSLAWPLIVKPATQDASVGLDQGSVVTNQLQLNERVALVLENYGPPVLVEEFIAGRELNVGLIENPEVMALPISEVLFVDKDPAYWPIVTYDAKWAPGSRDFQSTPARYPAEVNTRLARRLETLARRAFHLLGCRDYARVDFRVRSNGRPYILEVNPNPDFNPTAGLAGGLTSAGITHAQFTISLINHALRRDHQETLADTN